MLARPAGAAAWDIVRVDFPNAETAATRRRPALVVATATESGGISLLWLLMITSAAHRRWPLDVPVSDLHGVGLSHPCVVRVAKIATLDARLATGIGELAAADRVAVARSLHTLLGAAHDD